MKRASLFLIVFLLTLAHVSYSQDYFSNLVSALNKSHSAEAMASLGGYKSSLIGCMTTRPGKESTCVDSINFVPSSNFDYSFSIPPKDGSQAWAIKASGKGNYTPDDTVILSSDESGTESCSSHGKMANSC